MLLNKKVYICRNKNIEIMTTQLEQYETQIQEIANLAKKLNYDINGDLKPLLKLWLKEGLKFQNFVEDNKEDFIRTIKQFLK